MEKKICNNCNVAQLLIYFDKEDNRYRNTCKKCRYEYIKKFRKGIKNNVILVTNKQCITCKKNKPVKDFNKLSTNKDGLCNYCRCCYAINRKKNY